MVTEADTILRFFDTHTHLLPGMDDGSSSLDESIRMLDIMKQQGVTHVCLTSHYYPFREPLTRYLERRDSSFEQLKPELEKRGIIALLGAEVRLSDELFNLDSMDELCLGDSRLLLLEPPFRQPVTQEMVNQIERFTTQFYVRPVIAHFNRYDLFKDAKLRDQLRDIGCYLQMNLEALHSGPLVRRRALKLIRDGEVDMLGSDSHNLAARKPNIAESIDVISKDSALISEFKHIYERTCELLGQ